MIFNPFQLKSILSPGSSVNEDDMRNIKRAFGTLGYYTGQKQSARNQPDADLFDSIKAFQSDLGLKRDGVITPGGETAQALGQLLAKRRARQDKHKDSVQIKGKGSRSLLEVNSSKPMSIASGEHDYLKHKLPSLALPENTRQQQLLTKSIRNLLEVIRRKDIDHEVTSSNGRLVKAALKLSDHKAIANMHATAIRDFGDEALAEIINFKDQLHTANKGIHDSWLVAFANDHPEAAQKIQQIEKIHKDHSFIDETGRRDAVPLETHLSQKPLDKKRKILPVPDEKKDMPGLNAEAWKRWNDSINNLPNVSSAEAARYRDIFAWEGGEDASPSTDDFSGIKPDTMQRAIDDDYLPETYRNKRPKDLTPDERAIVYRYYFDDTLGTIDGSIDGHRILDHLPDERLGKAFADTMFTHGRGAGATIIQQAIENVSPGSLRTDEGDGVDGKMGPNTFKAFKKLADDPDKRRELLDALRDTRINFIEKNYPANVHEGWKKRAHYFGF